MFRERQRLINEGMCAVVGTHSDVPRKEPSSCADETNRI